MTTAKAMADLHEKIAWEVGPEEAWKAAQRLRAERDRLAAEHLPPEEDAFRLDRKGLTE